MLMTNPEVQRFAASVPVSAEFRAKMAKLGYGLGPIKSMWNAFTGWVRKALGLPEGSETLLDHAMRPLQDIIDRGAAFNKALPKDPELRQAAAPAADAARHALPEFDRDKLKDEGKRLLNIKGKGDKLRRAALAASTLDNITTRYKGLFRDGDENHLENFRKAAEAEQARTRDFRDQYSEKVNRLLDGLKGPERDKLAQLMNDATIADVRLGPGADNAHVKDTEALRRLQARYDALSPEAHKTYDGLRDYYRETYDIERKAQLGAMIKTALPDATPEQVKALTQAAKTLKGIRQLIDNPDASPAAASFADAWDRNRALVRGIARVHAQGFVQGDYYPLRRFGDYVITYGDKGTDNYGVEMFERRSDAEIRRAELARAGVEPSQVLDKRQSKLRSMLNTTVMDELDQAIRHSKGFTGEQADTVRDMFAGIMLQHASRSEAARTRMRRHGVAGASKDVERVLAQDFLALSSRLGYLEHGPERAEALAAMQRQADYLGRTGTEGQQIAAQAVLNELEKRAPQGDDAAPGTLAHQMRRFSSFGWAYSLMSPSHVVVNTLEAHMNAASLLGARHGAARGALALGKAMREIAPSIAVRGAKNTLKAFGEGLKAADWHLANHARDQLVKAGADRSAMVDLFDRLNNAGLIDHSMVREMQRIANPKANITKGWWDRFLDFDGAMQHAADVANKSAVAKAAYDLELRKTGSHDAAVRFAVETARKAAPNYNLVNKARIATDKGPLGAMAAPIMQFKSYGLHMYGVMANLAQQSMHGADRADRMEARKALAGILATRSLAAGTLTLIADPLRWVGGFYDWITGAQRPHDYEADVRSWIADAFGPQLGEIISRGVPHAAGIDIHRRIGLDNMLNFPDLEEFSTKGYAQAFATAVSGAAGQDAAQMAEGFRKIWHGDIQKGILDFIPVRMARDLIKAGVLNDGGVTDSRGKTILPADKVHPGEVAAQALGFQPAQISEFRERRAAIAQAKAEQGAERGQILARYAAAAPADRADMLDAVRTYNQAHPSSSITRSQLLQAVKRQKQTARDDRSAGLSLPKKQRTELENKGAFANVR